MLPGRKQYCSVSDASLRSALLRKVFSEIQPYLNLPWLDADQIGAYRLHHSLAGKTLFKVFFVVWVQWLKDLHKLLVLAAQVFGDLSTPNHLLCGAACLYGVIKQDVKVAGSISKQSQQQGNLSPMMHSMNSSVLHEFTQWHVVFLGRIK